MFKSNKKNGIICAPIEPKKTTDKPETEEWIWVEGYKGTDRDMRCRDCQFELGKQFDIPGDEEVKLCHHGFHFCKELRDVYEYYALRGCHRFFKVKALVRKSDYDGYGRLVPDEGSGFTTIDKLVAKSIIFERELTLDELIRATKFKDCEDEEFKKQIRENGVRWAQAELKVRELVGIGYCREMAEYCADSHPERFALARALGNQDNVSWETRFKILFNVK